ncbi:MAG: metallophosphoesterase [Woeseiaceae bacterium]|jgi:hypothetical protein
MRLCRASFHILLALNVALAFAVPARAAEWTFDGVERVVAISDIHGDYGAMVQTLQKASVLDDELAWSGGSTHLVIVGDIVDRGADSRVAMDLLMRLEDEADSAGGKVHVLIGNHEAMNLSGDLRYVSSEEYAAFADEELAEDREHWFEVYAARRAGDERPAEEQRVLFDQDFPKGFFAHRKAFASDGKYGSWLLSKPVIIVINGNAFVHGGLSPMVGEIGLQGVNGTLLGELADYVRHVETLMAAELLLPSDSFYDHAELVTGFAAAWTADPDIVAALEGVTRLNDSALQALDGPLWYRGNVACSAVIEIDRLSASLAAIGAERVVIGHTPTPGRRVLERFDGTVIEVDTGMLNSYYEGRGNALVIADGQMSSIDEAGDEVKTLSPHPRKVGSRRGAELSAEAIESLLRGGEVIAAKTGEAGQEVLTISDGSQTVDAVFVDRAGRNFFPDVAAYRLDRLLDLDMVPVTVKREIDGDEGSLQFLPSSMTNELQRSQSGAGGGAMCPLPIQWGAMMVFDALIFNEGRTAENIRYDRSSWQLILAGHMRTFGTSKSRPPHLKDQQLSVGPTWQRALSALTEERLEAELGDVLDRRRLRALLARRDALIEPGR